MADADCLDLVVATPGVATARLRGELESLPEHDLAVVRATRCGSLAADLSAAARLRVAVVPCGVSLHAADRLGRRLRAARQSVDSIVLCRGPHESAIRPATRMLAARFECPVALGPAADSRRRCSTV